MFAIILRTTRNARVIHQTQAGRYASDSTKASPQPDHKSSDEQRLQDNAEKTQQTKTSTQTTQLSDEEVQRRMAALSGDGGEAGVEYEDGQPVAMKRSVKNNMFRYI